MTHKKDIWGKPEINSTTEDGRIVSFWKQQVWEAIPNEPKSEEYDKAFVETISKLSAKVEAVNSKEQIFDVVDYLVDEGILGVVSWRLYGATEAGRELNFDDANEIYHVPASASIAEAEANGTHFGMSEAESRLACHTFISADNPNLRVYRWDDEGNKRALFELDDIVFIDPDDKFDETAKTFIFYKGVLVQCSDQPVEVAKELFKSELEDAAKSKDKDSTDEKWDEEAYITCTKASLLPADALNEERLMNDFGFRKIISNKIIDKEKAVAMANVCCDHLSEILNIDDKSVSHDGKWELDATKDGLKHISAEWLTNLIDNMSKEDYRTIVQPFFNDLKFDDNGKETSLYSEYRSSGKWILKGRLLERDMAARAFECFVSETAVKHGIENPFFVPHEKITDDEMKFRINDACRGLIDRCIEAGILHERTVQPVEMTEVSESERKLEHNIFMRQSNEQKSGPRM